MRNDTMSAPMSREEFGAAMKTVMESGGTWPRDNMPAVQRAAEQIIAHDAALRAALAAAERERDDWHATVKAITDEWNEECPAECDSFAHVEDCAAVSIASAMRDRRKRAEAAEARAVSARQDALEEAAKVCEANYAMWGEAIAPLIRALAPRRDDEQRPDA